MNALIQQIKALGPVRLAIAGAIIVALIAFLIYVVARMGGTETALLYGDLSKPDAAKITQRLDQMNVPYQIRADGAQIYVPVEQVAKTRISLAGEGLPSGGSIGYEIFDQAQGLATSSFVQNINQLRALEGELARTIRGIDNVKDARVHLVLPTRELFSRERQEPSASVLLRMTSSQRLEKPQVVAIQNIIAASVPNLKPERIAIADERGQLLARGGVNAGSTGAVLEQSEELRLAYEQRIARQIENLVERSIGFGKARVEASAEVDYSRMNETEEVFNPEQQVLRSSQNVNDSSEQSETDGNPSVTIANNLPTGSATAGGATTSQSRSNRTEETLNYEISKRITNRTRDPGAIALKSVAVLVDHKTNGFDENQKPVMEPRTAQEIAAIRALVASAAGLSEGQVEVVNMPFASLDADVPPAKTVFGNTTVDELMEYLKIAVLGLVGILVVLMVVRPLLARLFDAVPSAATAGAGAQLLGQNGMAQLGGPRDMIPAVEIGDSIEEMIDLNRIEGRVKASSLRKIGEIIEKHPEDVVAILRGWLYQESGA
ncbi:flagellar M-ring protein [Elstera cyanobacteriorum]|uniref:Flagellar M-ring protein n=1 Tax=Elstera cyanobacteriorum TaxID=2022747 RepID=A0A255XPM2_9PROT|nr:flagellar basal-body MS-ring/collar protein FliF [Elstera cyanobacteriorum]OYQ18937.1 flagellar M-ring protein FliF [Elstera cyanobacteriorum]GFZ76762.1 flagellar M-ring protein [Elstera cyanobacteriorum]